MLHKKNTLLLFFMFVCTSLYTQKKQFLPCILKNTTTYSGEKYTYTIQYNLLGITFNAGQVTFTNTIERKNNTICYHITGNGYTYKKYDWIYRVRDSYETYIDTNTMLPIYFKRTVDENGKKYIDEVTFNRITNIANSNKKNVPITNCTQDVLSSIYYARNINYKQLITNTKIPLDMFLDNELHAVYIKYIGTENILCNNKSYMCYKVKPLLVSGSIFKGGEAMTVWVSTDSLHYPLRIEAEILVGKVVVTLAL